MGSACSPRLGGRGLDIPDLRQKNNYGTTSNSLDDGILQTVFPVTHDGRRNSNIINSIQSSGTSLFEDKHFSLDSKKSLRLSILFNFQTNRTKIFNRKEETDITNFIQLNIEFTYVTSVLYMLGRKQAKGQILPRLIENQETNNYGAYSTYLWCNGEKNNVIIDDRMPTQNDNFLFLRVVKGIELWPLIIEKAWVKMIGGYSEALGLSPEESFEQITGIPAYTYTVKASNRQTIRSIIHTAKANKFWVVFIARNGLKDIQNRQVFMLDQFDYSQYRIISPFVSYQFERYNHSRRGEVSVQQQDIFSHFEHVVVGFNKDGYVPHSIPVKCSAREEVLFELQVDRNEDVSIRFNQFYHGYLKPADRQHYEYSPVLIQLYEIEENDGKRRYKLKDHCQGCGRSMVGARSTQCSRNIMESLRGKYLIKLEVDWIYDRVINQGNLVVYGSEGNIRIHQLARSNEALLKDVYPDIFTHDGTNDIILHQHNLEVHTYDKEKTTLIEFHNVTSDTHHFVADFSKSKNILLRGLEVSDKKAYVRLGPDEKTIVEVLPKDMRKHIEIQNFQIKKIPVKKQQQ